MSEKNKTYTAADFAAYHSGKMPEMEMYALEKATLEDPFLADALEGYVFTATAENDIAEIKDRLKDKDESNKVFFLSSSNKGWWRAAAAVIIIAGAGILFFNINKKVKDNTLAQTEIKPAVKETPSASPDTIIKEEEETDKITDAAQSNGLAKNKPGEKKATLPTLTTQGSTSAAPVSAATEYLANTKKYTLKGKVTDAAGDPVIAAAIKNKKNNYGALTDSSGSFALKADDSSVNATASALGYDSKDFALSKDKIAAVELNKNKAELEEVVVTGLNKTSVSKQLAGKVSGIQVNNYAAIPADGDEKFNAYVTENIQRFHDSSSVTHTTGTVVLSFELSKKGRPKNIFVVSSSCPACNIAAIKILKDGPAWIGKKGQRQTKSFTF